MPSTDKALEQFSITLVSEKFCVLPTSKVPIAGSFGLSTKTESSELSPRHPYLGETR